MRWKLVNVAVGWKILKSWKGDASVLRGAFCEGGCKRCFRAHVKGALALGCLEKRLKLCLTHAEKIKREKCYNVDFILFFWFTAQN